MTGELPSHDIPDWMEDHVKDIHSDPQARTQTGGRRRERDGGRGGSRARGLRKRCDFSEFRWDAQLRHDGKFACGDRQRERRRDACRRGLRVDSYGRAAGPGRCAREAARLGRGEL